MKIKMLVRISGTHDGEEWPLVGGVCEVSDASAVDMISAGFAEPVVGVPVETAVVDDVLESAVMKRGPGRPRRVES